MKSGKAAKTAALSSQNYFMQYILCRYISCFPGTYNRLPAFFFFQFFQCDV